MSKIMSITDSKRGYLLEDCWKQNDILEKYRESARKKLVFC